MMRSSETAQPIKSQLVKRISVLQLPASLSVTTAALKQKRNGGTTSYFYKHYKNSEDAKQFLATIEAATAHLMRLVFGPDFTPKVRVIISDAREQKPQIISKTLEHYTPAGTFQCNMLQTLKKHHQYALAKLILTVFCFKDPDLHSTNWGHDAQGTICHIDHDRKWSGYVFDFQSRDSQVGEETDPDLLQTFPNLMYSIHNAFAIISSKDVLAMPRFYDLKPYNHPFRRTMRSETVDEVFQFFASLSTDLTFCEAKFFYLTKFLLLPTPERVSVIVSSHSIMPNDIDCSFCENFQAEQLRIKNVLLLMPEYLIFLKNTLPMLLDQLYSEIDAYNQEFMKRHSEGYWTQKPAKAHFLISLGDIEKNIEQLIAQAEAAIHNDTPEKSVLREFGLGIARIRREISAYLVCENGLRYQKMLRVATESMKNNSIYSKSWSQLPELIGKDLARHYKECGIKKKMHDDYFKINSRHTEIDFLCSVLFPYIERRYDALATTLKTVSCNIKKLSLDTLKIAGYTPSIEQITTVWDSYSALPNSLKIALFIQLCDHTSFDNLPISARHWLINSFSFIMQSQLYYQDDTLFSNLYLLLLRLVEPASTSATSVAPRLVTDGATNVQQVGVESIKKQLLCLLKNPSVPLMLSKQALSNFLRILNTTITEWFLILGFSSLRAITTGEDATQSNKQYHVRLKYKDRMFQLVGEKIEVNAAPTHLSQQYASML